MTLNKFDGGELLLDAVRKHNIHLSVLVAETSLWVNPHVHRRLVNETGAVARNPKIRRAKSGENRGPAIDGVRLDDNTFSNPTHSESRGARVAIIAMHIEATPDTCGGKPRISGHRIRVQDIVLAYQRQGLSPDEIVSAYPTITLADVYSALAYYHDFRAEIDADIREADAFDVQFMSRQLSILDKIAARNAKAT